MDSRQRVRLIVGIVLFAVLGLGWGVWQLGTHFFDFVQTSQANASSAVGASQRAPLKDGRLFTIAEVQAFLASARKAEAIQNPLQRCLSYPDPPDSHWSADAVKAYCQYREQSIISFAEVEALIQAGHADELDRRLAQALHDQQTRPESRGLLDRIYYVDFNNGAFAIRPTLDAWKRESPNSPFALAASGTAYVAMASNARGGAYASQTSASNFEAMNRLLSQADDDLQRAVKLNPQVTPAYTAMIIAGSLGSGDAQGAGARGMAAVPNDYAIQSTLMSALEPKWGGSNQAMSALAGMAKSHVAQNPLLTLLLAEEPAIRYDICDCQSQAVLEAFPLVFDNVATTLLLTNAGYVASDHGHNELSAVYLSEAIRFNPAMVDIRIRRNFNLTSFGESAWALADANQLVQMAPSNAGAFDARGAAYESMHDYARAAQDLHTAMSMDADDIWAAVELGNIYVYKTHEWDEGWDMANRLIQAHPENSEGWILRAHVQEHQPRAGLQETTDYFAAHFDTSPNAHRALQEMRAALAPQPHLLPAVSGSIQ